MLLFEHAAALDYGQVSRNQGAGNSARDFACAAEDDHVAIGVALAVLVAHVVDDTVDLAGFVGGGCQRDVGVGMRGAGGLNRALQRFWFQVCAAESVGDVDDIGPRAIVAAERQDSCVGVIIAEVGDVGG